MAAVDDHQSSFGLPKHLLVEEFLLLLDAVPLGIQVTPTPSMSSRVPSSRRTPRARSEHARTAAKCHISDCAVQQADETERGAGPKLGPSNLQMAPLFGGRLGVDGRGPDCRDHRQFALGEPAAGVPGQVITVFVMASFAVRSPIWGRLRAPTAFDIADRASAGWQTVRPARRTVESEGAGGLLGVLLSRSGTAVRAIARHRRSLQEQFLNSDIRGRSMSGTIASQIPFALRMSFDAPNSFIASQHGRAADDDLDFSSAEGSGRREPLHTHAVTEDAQKLHVVYGARHLDSLHMTHTTSRAHRLQASRLLLAYTPPQPMVAGHNSSSGSPITKRFQQM